MNHVNCFSTNSATRSTSFKSNAAVVQTRPSFAHYKKCNSNCLAMSRRGCDSQDVQINTASTKNSVAAGVFLVSSLFFNSAIGGGGPVMPAIAYDDFASDTVSKTVQMMNAARGDSAKTLVVEEEIAQIITEGKGVGGAQNYAGVQLERGQVADEDTTIYNPGLKLLTESEKRALVDSTIANRKAGLASNTWTPDNEDGYDFIKTRLDPLHMTELQGYLGILPFYSALVYLAALAVQQTARSFFPVAYIVGALALFVPFGVLVAAGP